MATASKPIILHVEGIPKPQPRPRAFALNGRARVYDAGTAEGWKSSIAAAALAHRPAQPIDEPLRLMIRYYLPRPKGHFGKKGLRGSAPAHPCGKPDLDNLDKAVLDALTEIGMWRDDSLVCRKESEKSYGTRAGAEIQIHPLAGGKE